MNKLKFSCRTIAFFMVVSIISGWENIIFPISLAIDINTTTISAIFYVTLAMLFLTLNLFGALGLYLMQQWGFIVTYIAIIFSTLFFANNYIPLINKIFPLDIRPLSGGIINLLVLFYVVYLNILWYRKKIRRQT